MKRIVLQLIFLSNLINSQVPEEFGKTWTKFNINNISTYIYGDGRADIAGNFSGFEYPKGSGKYCVYESGFLFAGKKHNGDVRMGGSTYKSGMIQGFIMDSGFSQPFDDPLNRIFRVRKDWNQSSLVNEKMEYEYSAQEYLIRDSYKKDLEEWPWKSGAPFTDSNQNGIYDPGIDVPGFPDADMTIYFIANHSDKDIARQFYESHETNFEMQVTAWGYNKPGPLGNMIFKRYRIINKSDSPYNDIYYQIWCDSDIGKAADDFVGCDTLLSLGYGYNADDYDDIYRYNSPAVGFSFLSYNNNPISKISSFYYHVNENTGWGEEQGYIVWGFYNSMQGYHPATGELYEVPYELGGGATKYPLSGDPVSGRGFIDGMIKTPTDRRFRIAIGPFDLDMNEHHDIIIAEITAGGFTRTNRLQAISLLKEYAVVARLFAANRFEFPAPNRTSSLLGLSSNNQINLKWKSDPECYSEFGYEFQGYNIYQLPYAGVPISESVKIKIFDKVDAVTVITEEYFEYDQQLTQVIQEGNDWGIENELTISKDFIRNTDLHSGSTYYYAVTSYSYNPEAIFGSPSYESEPAYISVIAGENEEYDVEKINVFPNPYYGANPNELNKYERFVTFSHLPERATIRIFNLSGQLIRTINKTEPGQFLRWDLMNENYYLVPGGIYIAYIEMPDPGKTKILKLAVINENIVPDFY